MATGGSNENENGFFPASDPANAVNGVDHLDDSSSSGDEEEYQNIEAPDEHLNVSSRGGVLSLLSLFSFVFFVLNTRA